MNAKVKTHISTLLALLALLFSPFGFSVRGETVSVQEDGISNAAFVIQAVPTTMSAGQTYAVQVTMRNTGTTTWTNGAGYKLGSQNPQDNLTWGINRVPVPVGRGISPGKTITFRFTVTAPSVSGLFNFQWQMVREGHDTGSVFFGEKTGNVVVNVAGGTTGVCNATFVSQSVPAPMLAGQSYPVEIRMRNTGTTAWDPDAIFCLGSQNPPSNTTWGLNRIPVTTMLMPGEEMTFAFNAVAPTKPGLYNFQWQMVRDGNFLAGFFGELTPNLIINVGSGIGTNDGAFVSQVAPATIGAGLTFGVSVTMQNTGTTTWTTETGYHLGSQTPANNLTWGVARAVLPGPVEPGQSVTFSFNAVAPAVAGIYDFQWQMAQEGIGYFGQLTANFPITVTSEGTGDTGYGNNLSVPAVFAEGYGIIGLPTSVDPGIRPRPEEGNPSLPYFDPTNTYLLNGVTYYPQASPSTWQAQWMNGDVAGPEQAVVNWSDNLLNTKWTPKSVIRVENVLYKVPDDTLTAYTMALLSGSGTDERWGTDATTYLSNYRTVYTTTARLKVEKLDGPGGNVVAHPASFNGAIYEKYGIDGPGGYTAEVSVSGNLIFGYNWKLNSAGGTPASKLGWWRLTFSFDDLAQYTLDGTSYSVPCNVQMASLDPLDLQGRYFVPRLIGNMTTVLEIEIVGKRTGGETTVP